MVSVDEADRDVLRFIWVEDTTKDPPDLRIYRFTQVVFVVSSSPFLLNATIRFHLEKYLETSEGLVWYLFRSTYVDDIMDLLKMKLSIYTQHPRRSSVREDST